MKLKQVLKVKQLTAVKNILKMKLKTNFLVKKLTTKRR